jgi:uncharacterized protein with HEPN domain
MTQRDPLVSMRQMLDHASAVLRITEGKSDREITGDFVLWNAVLHLLQNVGEAGSNPTNAHGARRSPGVTLSICGTSWHTDTTL